MSDPSNKNEKLPPLGKAISWVDKPGSLSLMIKALIILCALLFLADFTYGKYGHFGFEKWQGVYGLIGFVAFTAIVLLARGLRTIIKRPENFYAPYSTDAEEMPEAETDVRSYRDE